MENGYTWIIKVTVSPDVVADGFDAYADQWKDIIMDHRHIGAPLDEVEVEVIEAPDPARIRKEQGYTDTVPDMEDK